MKRLLLSSIFIVSIFFCSTFNTNAQILDRTALAICNFPGGCQETPLCTLSDSCFTFDFYAPINIGNGNSVLKFKVTNFSSSPFKRATFELPGNGASTAPAVSPNSTFQNRFDHTVINKFNDSLIAFDAQLPNTFSSDSATHTIGYEVYYYVVKTADLNAPSGRKAQVTAEAGDGTIFPIARGVVNFDFDVCQGQCPTPIARLFLFPPGDLCLNNPAPYVISAVPQPNATFDWAITNGTIVSGQGTTSINFRPDSAAGTLRVTLVVTNQCKAAVASKLFNVVVCACPTVINTDCFKQDCCFSYQLLGSAGGELDQLRPAFEIIALCPKDVTSITFSTPVEALQPLNENPDFNGTPRTFDITTTPTLLTFANPVPPFGTTAAPDSAEDFVYSIPISAVTGSPDGRIVTITIHTATETFTQTFDLLNSDPSCGQGPLPVQLLGFNGKVVAQGVALTWKTATEKNNDHFDVERSQDGSHFERIGTVKGAGNSNSTLEYSFVDKESPKGLVYYRLNQVDIDKTSTHSPIVRVQTAKRESTLGVQLVPNPCQDKNCSVRLVNVNSNSPVTVEMHDLTGRLIFSTVIPADQTSFELPKVDSGAGVYLLTAKNGSSVAHQKVILK